MGDYGNGDLVDDLIGNLFDDFLGGLLTSALLELLLLLFLSNLFRRTNIK